MAKFEIEQTEGMRWVKVILKDDAVRTQRGALSYMQGDIALNVPLPSIRGMWVSALSHESFFRPRFQGTGTLHLESSLGGYHQLQIHPGEEWVLEPDTFWCAEEGVRLSVYREGMITSFWAGEGLIWYKTRASGKGVAMLKASGPVEEVVLKNERFVVDGTHVVARTKGLKFSIRRPSRGIVAYFLSGEKAARIYHGTGRLLLSATPYWRHRMAELRATGAELELQ